MGQWGNPQGRCSASSSATTNTDTFSPPTATPKPTSKPTAAPKPTEDWARLVFSSYRTGNCEIYRFEHRDNIFTEINLSKSSRAQDTHPRLNRTADQIVFASDRDRNLEIYRMDINGTSLARLTATPAEDTQPSWSPDSQHIVFASRRDGNWNLYVMNADGTNQHPLMTDPADDIMPSWSPDGQKIAWVRAGATTGAVWLMNADGSNPHPITGQLTYLQHPSWSPDGSRLAFDYDRDGDSFSDLGVVNANGSGLHAVPVPSLGPYQRLDLSIGGWSPEGERLLIGAVTYNLSNPPSIYNMYIGRVLVSGGSPTVLIFPEYDAMPDMRSLDLEPPHTTMTLLPAFSRARPTLIQWNGADAGVSGLASYDVQYRVGTTAAWTTWLTRTTDTSAMYTGIAGTTVTFRVRGRDVAGNTESWRTASGSDTSTTFYTWSLSGAVTDNRGMPIPAASLSLTPGAIRNVATDLSGDYLARLKASGNHTVVPGHTGYQAPPATSLSMDQDRDFSPYLLPNDNRVQNGGFEASSTTLTNWTHSGTLPAAVTTIDSHTGGRAALLGQPCAALCLSGAETVPADHSGYPPVPAGAVVDTLGTVHVLWTRIDQDIFPNAHVYYQSRSPDGTWSTATPIGVGESARLVLDSHQRLLAVWVTPDHRLIERQRPASGGAWSAPQDLGLANAAKLYTDHQGRAYVLYYCFSILGCPNTGEGLYRMRTAAGAWQAAHSTPTGDGSLAIGPDDTVHLVWHANNHGYAAVLLPGGSFSAPVQFGEEYQVYLPQAAIDSRGVVHVVWVLNGDTYYARQTPDGQWSSPVLLPKGGEPAQLVAGAGQVYLINTWTKAGDNNTYLRSISAAGLWSTPEKLLDGMHAV